MPETQTNTPEATPQMVMPTIVINNSQSNVQTMGIAHNQKSKTATLIMCLLGIIGLGGIHRFYTGHIILGIVYFFTAGFFGIGTILDLLYILTGSYKDTFGNPLK